MTDGQDSGQPRQHAEQVESRQDAPQQQSWEEPWPQQTPVAGQQNQPSSPVRARRRSPRMRTIVMLTIIGLICIGVIANAVSTPHAKKAAAAASPSVVQSSVAPVAQPDCGTQARMWISDGQLVALGGDVGTFSKAVSVLAGDMQGAGATASDTAAVQSEAASIQGDAQAVEANPAPSCITGLRGNVAASARDYSTAAIDATNALNQLSAGNTAVAASDMQDASAEMVKANAKIAAATSDVNAFNANQGS